MPEPQTLERRVQSTTPDHPWVAEISTALAGVLDPEIKRPITELGMVNAVDVGSGGRVRVEILLTVSGCPLKETLTRDVTAAARTVPGVTQVQVDLGTMSDEQRAQLRDVLKGGQADREIPFARADSSTLR